MFAHPLFSIKVLDMLLIVYIMLSLALPYILSGDRSLITFLVYVILTLAAMITAFARLRRWSEID
ncbi:MAG: hypothetical protein QXJ51_05310 [Sulfolobales archaeon]